MDEETRDEIQGATGASKSDDPLSELAALNSVVAALQTLKTSDARERLLYAAAAFFRLSLEAQTNQTAGASRQRLSLQPAFSEDRSISAKEFLIQKQPRTEVERVACLAYYLTHYRDMQFFKTIDISALNTEAAQPKFGNAAQAVENAVKTHYLAQAAKGAKQLSAAGEAFVQALPDRDAARGAMGAMRPRRRKKQRQQIVTSEQDSGDE